MVIAYGSLGIGFGIGLLFSGIAVILVRLWLRRRQDGYDTSARKDGIAPDKQKYLPRNSDSPRETLTKHQHAKRQVEQWRAVMGQNAVKLISDRSAIDGALGKIREGHYAPQPASPPSDSDDKE